MDPITMLAAFAPLFVQGGKAMISRWLAPKEFRPSTIDEWQKMQETEISRFKALNEAGGTNPTYLWVEAVIRLQRPFVVAAVFLTWVTAHLLAKYFGVEIAAVAMTSIDNAASIIGFYLFGERTMLATAGANSAGMSPVAAAGNGTGGTASASGGRK